MTIESLGVNCIPKCRNCKCGSHWGGGGGGGRGESYSIKAERELKVIENKLEFKGSYWLTGYPWKKDPNLLPNNYALKRLKDLRGDPSWGKPYCNPINDMITRGVANLMSRNLSIPLMSGNIYVPRT